MKHLPMFLGFFEVYRGKPNFLIDLHCIFITTHSAISYLKLCRDYLNSTIYIKLGVCTKQKVYRLISRNECE